MGVAVEVLPVEGAPQVGVTVTGLDGVVESVISVQVSWDGGDSWSGVRGAEKVAVTGSAFFRDFVPPLNAPATYRVEVLSGPDIAGGTEDSITVESDTAWIQDPLDPRGAVAVDAEYDTGRGAWTLASTSASFLRGQETDLVIVEGSRFPAASVGVRRAPSQVPLFLRAAASQGEMVRSLRALFDRAGTLVIRGMHSECPLDPVAHIVAGDVVESPKDGGMYGVHNTWELVVDQVRPTSMRVVVPWWTYGQVHALWQEWSAGATYDDVIATRPGDTYVDWQRDPEVP